MTDPRVPVPPGHGSPAVPGTHRGRERQARATPPASDEGITTGELLVLIALLAGVVGAVHLLSGGTGGPGGAVPAAMEMSGNALRVVGNVNGLAASDTTVAGIPVRFPREDPQSLGACVVTLSPLVGDMGGIDMDRVAITWSTGTSSVILPPLTGGPVEGPAWIIVDRSEFNPFQPEDGDRILEPGEQFTLLLVGPEPLGPGTRFTIGISPGSGGIPLTLSRTVPARVTPVMDLDPT